MKWLVRSAMVALYPSTETMGGIEATEVDVFLERYQREAPPMLWAGLVLGSALFAASPLLTVGRPLPSFLLDDETLDAHAHALAGHPIYLVRQATFLIKLAAGLCWGSDPKVRERFSLDPYPADLGTYRGLQR